MLAVSFLSICWPLLPWQGEYLGRWGPQLVPNWRTLMAWAVHTHLWRLRWKEWLAPTPGIHVAGALPPESTHSWRKKLLRQSHHPPYGLPTMGPRLIGAQASSLLPELPWLWGTTLVSPQAVSRQLISVHSPSWLLKPKSQQLALTHPAEEYLRLGSLAAMTTTCAGLSPTDPPETSWLCSPLRLQGSCSVLADLPANDGTSQCVETSPLSQLPPGAQVPSPLLSLSFFFFFALSYPDNELLS